MTNTVEKYKVLLIDDDYNIREVLKEVLELKNFDVKMAENGQDALDILDDFIPDIIICDIMMPVMDGFMFYDIVKDNKSLSAIPFIFLTAKIESDVMKDCLLNGADAFLTKPFRIDEILKVLKNKIERFEKIKKAYARLSVGETPYFSHEVNTPINGILGAVDLLRDKQAGFDFNQNEIDELYNCIKISGERLHRTLQKQLLYQKIIQNKFNIDDSDSSNILTVFLKVKHKLSYAYETAESRIFFDIEQLNLKISKVNLDFILFELIENALKFSVKKRIIISGRKYNSEYYELEIFDSGIGFSEEELKAIDAGTQFNREELEQQGLGMGLYLSKIIINKVKGVFSIASEKDVCTKILIYLSLVEETE